MVILKMRILPRSSAKTEARGEYVGVTDLMVCKMGRNQHPGWRGGIADPNHLVLEQPNHIAVAIKVWAEREDFQRLSCEECNHCSNPSACHVAVYCRQRYCNAVPC